MANLALMVVAFAAFFTIVTSFATTWLDGTSTVAEGFRVARAMDAVSRRARISERVDCINPIGTSTEFEIVNGGQTPLRNFEQWSLVASYRTSSGTNVETLAYTSSVSPLDDQWTVSEIRMKNGAEEVFGPGIIDPGEEATIAVKFSPGVWASTANSVSLTTDTGSVATIDFTGENECGYYLHNNPTPPVGNTSRQADLPANHTFPSVTTLYNYDENGDSNPGRTIARGGSGASENSLTKHQNWRTGVLNEELKLAGTVRVGFWSAMKNFSTTSAGEVFVYLRDYNGSTYTEIGNGTLYASPWDTGASGTWVEKTLTIRALNYTVPAGNRLEVKFIVGNSAGDNEMYFAYDTVSYPTFVEIPTVLSLNFHAEDRLVADSRYNQMRTADHSAGYYLQNNPSPTTLDTNAQANLAAKQVYPSATTLYNYDVNYDPNSGRRIVKGGSGATESDLTKYQNWRADAVTVDTKIEGTLRLDFWSGVRLSATSTFSTTAAGEVKVYLRDYNPSGGTYIEITNATLTATPWDAAASGDWVRRFVEIGPVNYTILRGRQLEVKLIVGNGAGGDMHFAYDMISYPTVLLLPGASEPDPGGQPFTDTVDGGGAIGRFRLGTNQGKWVFPLTEYARITDAQWTVKYRVKRKATGFFWRTDAADVTPGTLLQWVDVDLSAYLPEEATGAVVELVNTDTVASFSAVVRGKGDTNEYMPTLLDNKLRKEQHRWQIVRVDINRKMQAWVEHGAVKLKLIGYTIGPDPKYWTTPPNITPGTAGAWTTVNVSGYVDSDATGVILFIQGTSPTKESLGSGTDYAIREVGSSFSATNREITGKGNTLYMVGLNASKQFEAYIESTTDITVHLVGQTKASVVYYVNDVAVTDPTTGSWQEIDADTYAVPTKANGLILYAHNTANQSNEIGFRHGDSTDNWSKKIWRDGHMNAAIGINGANVWDEYMGSTNVNVSIAAYTVPVDPADADVHADLDVLIRRQNGQIRATLGTDVAATDNIDSPFWHTKSATFRPAEYAIVDPTDYLEVDVFAHVTRNDGTESAVVYFRFDDMSVAVADRATISSLGVYR